MKCGNLHVSTLVIPCCPFALRHKAQHTLSIRLNMHRKRHVGATDLQILAHNSDHCLSLCFWSLPSVKEL